MGSLSKPPSLAAIAAGSKPLSFGSSSASATSVYKPKFAPSVVKREKPSAGALQHASGQLGGAQAEKKMGQKNAKHKSSSAALHANKSGANGVSATGIWAAGPSEQKHALRYGGRSKGTTTRRDKSATMPSSTSHETSDDPEAMAVDTAYPEEELEDLSHLEAATAYAQDRMAIFFYFEGRRKHVLIEDC